MAENDFDLEKYLTEGVEILVKDILRASLSDPRESVFMGKFVRATRQASKKRDLAEKKGEHVPPFLIASITSSCNLHCAGCYSRANDACTDSKPVSQLSGEEWAKVFSEADKLGISFILLAGGEPLIRRDVLEEAAKRKKILFPVFTNGTMIKGDMLELLHKNRNLFPVLSIEGDEKHTDKRRGEGMYRLLSSTMDEMTKKGILFGASITVTKENLGEVLSDVNVH